MTRRFLLVCVVCWCAVAVAGAGSGAGARDKPNVVWVVTDDAGYADFGFTGCTDIRTPHIDRLAREGVVCTQAYVSASVCSPSRAGLVTGVHQQRMGYEFNGPGKPANGYKPGDMGLDVERKTVADHMRRLGYDTMVVGKWHLGLLPQYHPMERGFDGFYGLLGGSRSYRAIQEPGKGRVLYRDRTAVPESEVTYVTDMFADAAVRFIEQRGGKPFFLYLCFTAPHTPMHARADLLARYSSIKDEKRRKYAAMLGAVDEGIGRIVGALERQGVSENTLIVFTNDNGGATNNGSDNGRWRGMKGSKWEGGVRVPMILRWPAKLPGGTRYAQPVSTLDLLPTTVAAVGGRVGADVDGVDLLPFVRGQRDAAPHEYLLWRRGVAAGVRADRWKLIRIQQRDMILIDMVNDPRETRNVADEHAEIVKRLAGQLAVWERGLAQPRWVEGERWRNNQLRKHRMDVVGREAERKFP